MNLTAGLTFVSAILGSLFVYHITENWQFDDAYIYYRYASNIRQLGCYCYNPGEVHNGTTSPLWTLSLSILSPSPQMIPDTARIVSYVLLGLTGWICAMLFASAGFWLSGVAVLAAMIFSSHFVSYVGMESTLFICCATGTIYLFQRKSEFWSNILAGFTVLARPEGIILWILANLIWYPKTWSSGFRRIGAFLLPVSPWLLYEELHFGSLFPQTFTVKLAQGVSGMWPTFSNGLIHWIGSYISYNFPLIIILLWGSVTLAVNVRRYQAMGAFVFWGILLSIAYHILGVPNYHWYYAPLDVCIVIITWIGVTEGAAGSRVHRIGLLLILAGGIGTQLILYQLYHCPIPRDARLWGPGIVSVMLLTGSIWSKLNSRFFLYARILALSSVFLIPQWNKFWIASHADMGVREEAYKQAGIAINEMTSKNATLCCFEVGVLGYFSERTIIDPLGLVTPDIAHYTYKSDFESLLRNHHPDYILLHQPLWEFEKLLIDSEYFRQRYHWIDTFRFPGYSDLELWQKESHSP